MEKFLLSIEARMRHGILREALLKKGWTQKQAAEFLGVSLNTFSRWVNLKETPKYSPDREKKFFELTGCIWEDLWPKEIFTKEFLGRKKVIEAIREVPAYLLPQACGIFYLPPKTEEVVERKILREKIFETLGRALTPRQKRMIIKNFFEGKTLETIGWEEGLTDERVRQILDNSLKRLRNPKYKNHLKNLLKD